MRALRYVNKYFLRYKWRFLVGILITILSKILALRIPRIVSESLNGVEDYISGKTSDFEMVSKELIWNTLLMVGAAVLAGFFTFLMRQTIIVCSRLIEFDLKTNLPTIPTTITKLLQKEQNSDLMNRISEDVTKVRMYFGPTIMYSMNMLVLFIVGFWQMLQVDVN